MSKQLIYERECDNKEGALNWTPMFPMIWDIRESDIMEDDITEVRVYWDCRA